VGRLPETENWRQVMPIVQMPDGKLVNMPDSPTPEQLQQFRAMSPENPIWSGVKSGAVDIARGAGKGVGGLLTLLETNGMTKEGIAAKQRGEIYGPNGTFVPDPNAGPGFGERLSAATERQFPTPQGDSQNRTYVRKGLEGLGGALTMRGGQSVTGAAAGVGSGVGGEAGKQLSGGNPIAEFVGSIIGGVGAGAATAAAVRPRPQSAELAREAVENLPKGALERAQMFQQDQMAKGVRIDLVQALHGVGVPAGNLEAIRNYLTTRSTGNQTQKVNQDQSVQLAALMDKNLAKLPGTNYDPGQAANNAQDAATGIIKELRQFRTDTTRELYAKMGELPPEVRTRMVKEAKALMDSPDASTGLKTEVGKFLAKISGQADDSATQLSAAQQALRAAATPLERSKAAGEIARLSQAQGQAAGKPIHAAQINTAISEITGSYKNPLNPPDPMTAGQLKGFAGRMNKTFQEVSPEARRAEAEYARLSREVVDPMRKSVVGRVAGPQGSTPDREAAISRMDALFSRGTDPNARNSDIRTLGTELAKKSPDAFFDAWKVWVSKTFTKAQTVAAEGGLSENTSMAQNLSAQLKDPFKWQGVKDAMTVQSKLMGQPVNEVMAGLENLRRLALAMENRAPYNGMSPQEVGKMASKSATAEVVRSFGLMPFGPTARAIQGQVGRATELQFDKILTSPQGAKMLAELGKVPVMSQKAKIILGTFGGAQGTELESPEITP
jgi:hypothetical protein